MGVRAHACTCVHACSRACVGEGWRGRRGPCDFDLASTRTILLFFDCCLVLLFLRDSRTRISLGVHASLHTEND